MSVDRHVFLVRLPIFGLLIFGLVFGLSSGIACAPASDLPSAPRDEPGAGAPCPFDLFELSHLGAKGRFQDAVAGPNGEILRAILEEGSGAIPCLIERLTSEAGYEERVLPLWIEVFEGDVALVLLSDLFRDPAGRTSLPGLCWNELLERGQEAGLPAEGLLRRHLEAHGREALQARWREAWERHREAIYWDEDGRFFRARGRALEPCR